jgi:heptose I phosphotransferase
MIVLPPDLSKALGPNPFDALMNISGVMYRNQPNRETLRIVIEDHDYFIKKHRGITLKECLKNWFSGRQPVIGAKPEWSAIQALNKLGISSTPLVGYGQRGWLPFTQQSFLLTQALKKTTSLEDLCASWVARPPLFRKKLGLIQEVARISRVMHANGWVHRDYYLCHFLQDEDHRLHLIDLHRCQQPKFRLQRWIIKDLAGLLFSSLDCGLTRRDALRFLKAYRQLPLREILENDKKLLTGVIDRARSLYEKSHHRFPRQRWMNPEGAAPRLLSNQPRIKSRFFKRYCIVPDFDTLHAQTLCTHPDSYFHSSAIFLKQGDSSTVVLAKIGEQRVVIKRYNRKNILTRFKRYLGPSKASRTWKNSETIARLGIATARPLAFIEKRFGHLNLDSYFVCEYIDGRRLDDFVRSNPSVTEQSLCAEALVKMMFKLKTGMCQHGDLKSTNILWDGKEIFLLDTDAVKIYKNPVKFARAHASDWNRLLRNWDEGCSFSLTLALSRNSLDA